MAQSQTSTRWGFRWFDAVGSVLWIVLFCLVIVLVLTDPAVHSVVISYSYGAERFLATLPMYDLQSTAGFVYLPASAVLYVPFYEFGPYLGDVLWRLAGFAVLTYAAFRQTRILDDEKPLWLISCAFFLALPLSAGAVRNGQATILLTGACWLLTLVAIESKPMRTALWAAIGLASKPTAIVMVLLAGGMRPRLIPVLVAAIAAVMLLPYPFAPHQYVTGLYREFFGLMDIVSLKTQVRFTPADFTAPFTTLGIAMPAVVASAVRIVAALATLSAALWFLHNGEKRSAGLAIFILAAYYMCVFNPRVEGNTYAMLALPFGMAISLMFRKQGMTALPIVLGTLLFLGGLSGIESHVHKATNLWFQAVITTPIFIGIIWWLWRQTRTTEATAASVRAPT